MFLNHDLSFYFPLNQSTSLTTNMTRYQVYLIELFAAFFAWVGSGIALSHVCCELSLFSESKVATRAFLEPCKSLCTPHLVVVVLLLFPARISSIVFEDFSAQITHRIRAVFFKVVSQMFG